MQPVQATCVDGFMVIPRSENQIAAGIAARFATTALARGLQVLRSRIYIDPRLAEHPETCNTHSALERLLNTHGHFYSGNVVDEYLQVLQESYPQKFCYTKHGVIHLPSEAKSLFQLAVELHKSVCDREQVSDVVIPYDKHEHHVVIYIDRRMRRVEYYDPLGRASERDLRSQLDAIRSLFFGGTTSSTTENRTPHQKCMFRCALWGLHYIDRRLRGRSHEELCAEPFSNEAIDAFKKDEVAKSIEQRAQKILAELKPIHSESTQEALIEF